MVTSIGTRVCLIFEWYRLYNPKFLDIHSGEKKKKNLFPKNQRKVQGEEKSQEFLCVQVPDSEIEPTLTLTELA